MSIGILYVSLLALGVFYAFLTGVLGWFSDLGGVGVHLDASGHLDAGSLHPISGTTVATCITGFGAGGVVAHTRDFEMKKADYDGAVNLKRADADLAYDIQRNRTSQELKREEVQIAIVEKEQQIAVQDR